MRYPVYTLWYRPEYHIRKIMWTHLARPLRIPVWPRTQLTLLSSPTKLENKKLNYPRHGKISKLDWILKKYFWFSDNIFGPYLKLWDLSPRYSIYSLQSYSYPWHTYPLSFNKLKKFSFNGGAAREKRLTGVSSTSYHNLYLANYNLLTPRAETSIRATEWRSASHFEGSSKRATDRRTALHCEGSSKRATDWRTAPALWGFFNKSNWLKNRPCTVRVLQ